MVTGSRGSNARRVGNSRPNHEHEADGDVLFKNPPKANEVPKPSPDSRLLAPRALFHDPHAFLEKMIHFFFPSLDEPPPFLYVLLSSSFQEKFLKPPSFFEGKTSETLCLLQPVNSLVFLVEITVS
ncbi:hypothetical protein VNO77_41863 [Canavalia gladiata]|uniref:Uncharacterized protein n=1 Tax=Canavalia gladiata TaxID=3824 RepID=A0AAN9K1F7_CANGL